MLQGTDVTCTCIQKYWLSHVFSINQQEEPKDIISFEMYVNPTFFVCCQRYAALDLKELAVVPYFHPSVNPHANISTQVVCQHTILEFQYQQGFR